MTTRQQFIHDWRYEIEGWVLDAAMTHRTGAELSTELRHLRAKIEAKLGAMYDALQAPPAKPSNGVPAQPAKDVKRT